MSDPKDDLFTAKDGKKIAAGAVIGAIVAVPVPFVGWFAGAVIGGGLVALRKLMKD